ncbi:MAG TPA: hypothetical protein VMF50_02995, partial [Candidatus Binataceae bacterium]|nr:hypothetical protein [Candidatus Binataceae bacterium]
MNFRSSIGSYCAKVLIVVEAFTCMIRCGSGWNAGDRYTAGVAAMQGSQSWSGKRFSAFRDEVESAFARELVIHKEGWRAVRQPRRPKSSSRLRML